MAEMLIQSESLTAIADKIRVLKDISQSMSLDDMEAQLDIPKNDSSDLTASGATVTVPAGYYASQATKSVATTTQATPSVSIDSAGKITASATQTAGYVSAGTKSGTKQLTTQAAKTITPSTSSQTAVASGVYTTGAVTVAAIPSTYVKPDYTKGATTYTPSTTNQTIASGTYLTGVQTIKGDNNLVASNIKKGSSIFGVSGSYEGVELNFKVVGGTSQPSNPVENTIWVNTSTEISSWAFSATEPSNPTNGMVWILVGVSSAFEFNALKENTNQIYPISAKQYVSGTFVNKDVKSYQGGEWKNWIEIIDFDLTSWTFKNPYPSRSYTRGTYDLSNKTLKGTVSTTYQHVVMVKNEKINFSSSNQLKFVYSLSRNLSSYGAIIVKVSSSNSDPTDASCVVNQQINAFGTNTEVAIDVSSLNYSYYLWIGLAVWGSAGTVNFEVSNLHLK